MKMTREARIASGRLWLKRRCLFLTLSLTSFSRSGS